MLRNVRCRHGQSFNLQQRWRAAIVRQCELTFANKYVACVEQAREELLLNPREAVCDDWRKRILLVTFIAGRELAKDCVAESGGIGLLRCCAGENAMEYCGEVMVKGTHANGGGMLNILSNVMTNGTFTSLTCSDPLRRRGGAWGDGHVLTAILQEDFAKRSAMILREQGLLVMLGVLSSEHSMEWMGACDEVPE